MKAVIMAGGQGTRFWPASREGQPKQFLKITGNFLSNIGLPLEMQIPIALAELVAGILLIIGVLSRLSVSLLSIIILGAIFHVKGAQSLTGDGGIEFELILLASFLVIMIAGPGRISLSHVIKKIPRCLH